MNHCYPDYHLHISPGSIYRVHQEISPGFLNSTSEADIPAVVSTSTRLVFPFIGLHPWFAGVENQSVKMQIERLSYFLDDHKTCGIGECGLDFSPKYKSNRSNQIAAFELQLGLSNELKRPLSIHCVKAWEQLFNSLKSFMPLQAPMILHSFYGSNEILKKLIELNSYISLSSLSFKNSGKTFSVIRNIPMNRLLVESDLCVGSSDYSPDQHLNTLQNNYKTIAEIKSLTKTELISGVIENGKVFTN